LGGIFGFNDHLGFRLHDDRFRHDSRNPGGNDLPSHGTEHERRVAFLCLADFGDSELRERAAKSPDPDRNKLSTVLLQHLKQLYLVRYQFDPVESCAVGLWVLHGLHMERQQERPHLYAAAQEREQLLCRYGQYCL
jgi:hypothetical protein